MSRERAENTPAPQARGFRGEEGVGGVRLRGRELAVGETTAEREGETDSFRLACYRGSLPFLTATDLKCLRYTTLSPKP